MSKAHEILDQNNFEQPIRVKCGECEQLIGVVDRGLASEPFRFIVARHSTSQPGGERTLCPGSHSLVKDPEPTPPIVTKDEFGLRYQNASAAVDRLYELIRTVNSVTEQLAEADLDVRYEIVELQRLGRPVSVRMLSPRVSQLIRPTKDAATIIYVYECGCSLQTKHDNCPHHGAPFVVERKLGD